MGRFDNSLENFSLADSYLESHIDSTYEVKVFNSMGVLYFNWKKFKKSEQNHNLALELSISIKDTVGIIMSKLYLVDVYREQYHLKKAKKLLKELDNDILKYKNDLVRFK